MPVLVRAESAWEPLVVPTANRNAQRKRSFLPFFTAQPVQGVLYYSLFSANFERRVIEIGCCGRQFWLQGICPLPSEAPPARYSRQSPAFQLLISVNPVGLFRFDRRSQS